MRRANGVLGGTCTIGQARLCGWGFPSRWKGTRRMRARIFFRLARCCVIPFGEEANRGRRRRLSRWRIEKCWQMRQSTGDREWGKISRLKTRGAGHRRRAIHSAGSLTETQICKARTKKGRREFLRGAPKYESLTSVPMKTIGTGRELQRRLCARGQRPLIPQAEQIPPQRNTG